MYIYSYINIFNFLSFFKFGWQGEIWLIFVHNDVSNKILCKTKQIILRDTATKSSNVGGSVATF